MTVWALVTVEARVIVTVLPEIVSTLDGFAPAPPSTLTVNAPAAGFEFVSRSSAKVSVSWSPLTAAAVTMGAMFALTVTFWPAIQPRSPALSPHCSAPGVVCLEFASVVKVVPPRFNTVPRGRKAPVSSSTLV